jgi:hypothetical protein
MIQRTSLKVALALGVLALLVLGAALLSGGPAEVGAPASDGSRSVRSGVGPLPSPTAPLAGQPPPREPRPTDEPMPMPGCWSGLREFDRHASLDTFRQALGNAIAGRDARLTDYLKERLTELVGNDSARALQVLDWARQAMPPELNVYMDALKAADAIHRPEVVERILQMGEDKASPVVTRGAAMDALETQKRFSPATLARVKAIALDESLDSAAWVATRTLGRVMKQDFESGGDYARYWKELLDISERTDDLPVKMLALEMPTYSDPLRDADSMKRLDRIMRTAPERDVREMAAYRLAFTEHPDKALEYYREAFPQEQDLCMRWALMRFAVRAAGPSALPLLAQFAAQEPRLERDYQDFQRLYADGTTDWSRIWMNKAEYHSCTVEEGAPH